jgi:hydrogenase nickel incorporation protein HypA/HybF
MHELSVCESLLTQVSQLAAQHNAHQVALIKLQIGPLSGIEPDLLQHAFTIARAGTVAAHAKLVIDTLAVRIECLECSHQAEAPVNHLVCPQCGAWRTKVIGGDEMVLASLELLTE